MSMRIEPVPREAFEQLAAFIHQHNRRADGRLRCLHADHGESAASHLRELLALPAQDSLFLVAHEGDRWLGVIGAEQEPAAGRAWVRGPLLAHERDGATLRGALLQALATALPALQRLDAFWQADEAALSADAVAAGWRQRALFHVMEAHAGIAVPAWPASVHDASGDEAGALMSLHELTFPATYLPPQALLSSLDDDHRLLVLADGEGPAGYLYVQHRRADGDGYIDYLAVAERARGRGLGRTLLQAALQWTLGERGLPIVSLTVQQDRVPALGLYLAAGFQRGATGVHMILQR